MKKNHDNLIQENRFHKIQTELEDTFGIMIGVPVLRLYKKKQKKNILASTNTNPGCSLSSF